MGFDADLELDQVRRPLTQAYFVRGSVEFERLGLLTDLSCLQFDGAEPRLLRRRGKHTLAALHT